MRCLGALLLCIGTAAAADPKPDDPIKMTVTPTAAPTPSLRYKLLPELRDQTPGNAALIYYRAYSPEWQGYRKPEQQKLIEEWLTDKSKVPPDELKWVTTSQMLLEVDRAARREYCNWELLPRIREHGIALLLPDLQGFRELSRLLLLRARFELAAGEYDKAVETLKTGFTMARHISQAGTLIHALVGLAIAQHMCDLVERCMATPGAPNLYHALTYLPQPLIDMRHGYEGERMFLDWLLPGMREQVTPGKLKVMNADELREIGARLEVVAKDVKDDPAADRIKKLPGQAEKLAPDARKALRELGHKGELVDKLPDMQAVLLTEIANSDRLYDSMILLAQQPYPEGHAALAELEKEIRADKPGHTFTALLLPSMGKVHNAQARFDRRVAALRVIEAVRLHAAANKGKLPANLDAVKAVKVPNDPTTGKAFGYEVEGDTSTLSSPEMGGLKMTYVVTVKP